jgi:hypothetical protein
MRRAGFLAVLATSVMCFHAIALAAGELPAADAYNERLKTIANKALHSALMKHPDRLNGVAMKIHYAVDQDGHVHNVKVMSRTHDNSAENIVANALAAITFPPIPIDAQLEVRAGYFEVEAEVTLAADALTAAKVEAPTAYDYNMRVHHILQDDVGPSFHAPHHLEVNYEFLSQFAGSRYQHEGSCQSRRAIGGADHLTQHSPNKVSAYPAEGIQRTRAKTASENLRDDDLGSTVTGLTPSR